MGVVARSIRRALPERWQVPARYYYERARGLIERELPLAVAAIRPGDRVVDVGANVGIYTYAFARAGARVEAFEPQAACATVLRSFAAAARRVHVHEVALDATAGEATLAVPNAGVRVATGNARIGQPGPGQNEFAERVKVATLDSFAFDQLHLIKIDVEGAELGVIEGGVATLEAHGPLLLVEIEQRHHPAPIAAVFDRISALGYDGYFLDGTGRLRPLVEFDLEQMQIETLDAASAGPYINNFLFQTRSAKAGGHRWVA